MVMMKFTMFFLQLLPSIVVLIKAADINIDQNQNRSSPSSSSILNITNIMNDSMTTIQNGHNMTNQTIFPTYSRLIYQNPNPDKFVYPLLNVTCFEERDSIIGVKEGRADILKCCSQELMCVCFKRHCENDMNYKGGKFCKFLDTHQCHMTLDCQDLGITYEKCMALPNVNRWLLLVLIVLGAAVAFSILVLICMIAYKKFKAYNKVKKHGGGSQPTHLRMALAPRPNVTSHVMYTGASSQQPSSSSSSSAAASSAAASQQASRNSKNSSVRVCSGGGGVGHGKSSSASSSSSTNYNRGSSNKPSTSLSSNRGGGGGGSSGSVSSASKQNSNYGHKFSKASSKPTRSFLQRAVS